MNNTTKHIVLKAENLSIGYTSKKEKNVIAENINFKLYKGELIGLIGGNGIGKSTLLRTITNQQKALSGQIYLNDIELSKLKPINLAQQLSVVFTEDLNNTNLSAQELIALGRQPYTNWLGTLTDLDKQKTQEALELIKITHLADTKCYQLSDGQLQKVMLARALAQDTPLIILDEPTTHLDLYHKVSVLKLLQKLAKQTQKTILFSTHEINVALSLCDQLIVMKKNSTQFGTPQELIEQEAFFDLFPEDLVTFNVETSSFKIK